MKTEVLIPEARYVAARHAIDVTLQQRTTTPWRDALRLPDTDTLLAVRLSTTVDVPDEHFCIGMTCTSHPQLEKITVTETQQASIGIPGVGANAVKGRQMARPALQTVRQPQTIEARLLAFAAQTIPVEEEICLSFQLHPKVGVTAATRVAVEFLLRTKGAEPRAAGESEAVSIQRADPYVDLAWRYRRALLGQAYFSRLDTAALQLAADAKRNVGIGDLFEPLWVREEILLHLTADEKTAKLAGEGQMYEATRFLRDRRVAVLIGKPGSGKSSLLKFLVWYGCNADAWHPDVPRPLIPVFIRARETHNAHAGLVDHAVHAAMQWAPDMSAEEVRTLLTLARERDELVLLFDALDEAAPAQRQSLVTLIDRAIDTSGQSRWRLVITTRPSGYPEEFRARREISQATLVEWTEPQVRTFFVRFGRALYQHGPSGQDPGEAFAVDLVAALGNAPAIAVLAGVPILATIIAHVQLSRGHLPNTRFELYQHIAQIFAEVWFKQHHGSLPAGYKARDLLDMLRIFGFHMMEGGHHKAKGSAAFPSEQELWDWHREARGGAADRALFEQLLAHAHETGLWVEVGVERDGTRRFGFLHQSFTEYFAGLELVRGFNRDREAVIKRVLAWAADQTRWEAIALGIASLGVAASDGCWSAAEVLRRIPATIETPSHVLQAVERNGPVWESMVPGLDLMHLCLMALPDWSWPSDSGPDPAPAWITEYWQGETREPRMAALPRQCPGRWQEASLRQLRDLATLPASYTSRVRTVQCLSLLDPGCSALEGLLTHDNDDDVLIACLRALLERGHVSQELVERFFLREVTGPFMLAGFQRCLLLLEGRFHAKQAIQRNLDSLVSRLLLDHDLAGIEAPGLAAHGLDLANRDLRGANLSNARLPRANLSTANLAGANLSGANLSSANFASANLTDADLAGADLPRARLWHASLTGAHLTGVKLAGANLTGVNLTGANLTGADLTGVKLAGASLNGADLTGANLTGADLTNVRGLSAEKLEWALSATEDRSPETKR